MGKDSSQKQKNHKRLNKTNSATKLFMSTLIQWISAVSLATTPFWNGIDFYAEYTEVQEDPTTFTRPTRIEASTKMSHPLRRHSCREWTIPTCLTSTTQTITISVQWDMSSSHQQTPTKKLSNQDQSARKAANYMSWWDKHRSISLWCTLSSGAKSNSISRPTGQNSSTFAEERREFSAEKENRTRSALLPPSTAWWLLKN